MEHLDEISVEELQDALDNVEGKKPTERLLAAIAYKNGVTQAELAQWYDVHRKTIYNWLNRLDTDESLSTLSLTLIVLGGIGNLQKHTTTARSNCPRPTRRGRVGRAGVDARARPRVS